MKTHLVLLGQSAHSLGSVQTEPDQFIRVMDDEVIQTEGPLHQRIFLPSHLPLSRVKSNGNKYFINNH